MDKDIILDNNNNDKHAKPSTEHPLPILEFGDTPTISRQSSASSENSALEPLVGDKLLADDDGVSVLLDQTYSRPVSARTSTASKSEAYLAARAAALAGTDPARIPSSVFGAKASTPMEWSFASNESLFSIHVGNTSFSKDQFLNMFRSGELTKFDHELARFSGVVTADMINYGSEIADQSYADSIPTPPDVPNKERDRFDWSYNATAQSFQFPVLVGNYDNGMISSPKMEPRRHRAMEKWNHHTAEPSPVEVVPSREQSRRFESKQQNEHDTPNWLFCLTCCFKPCR